MLARSKLTEAYMLVNTPAVQFETALLNAYQNAEDALAKVSGYDGADVSLLEAASTKPDYSTRWWRRRKLTPPRRDAYRILSDIIDYRFASVPPRLRGVVKQVDARNAINAFPHCERRVSLVVTSPPYLDTTNFEEDQWLRLWFLGGPPRPNTRRGSDNRHVSEEKYWDFLTEAWSGVGPLLKRQAHLVIRIGGKRLELADAQENLHQSLEDGLEKKVSLVEARTSEIRGGQLKIFQPDADGVAKEHDFHFALGL
jgi:hypothetical protein